MQRWEYAILDCKLNRHRSWCPWQFKGNELPNWQNLKFSEFLDELGNQGWELVGFSHSSSDAEYWVFKRPRMY